MLKKFIEGVKDVLPAIGGTIGYAVAGPAGAALGSGLGSIVRGDPGQEAFQNALLAGTIGAGGQRFLSGGSGPIGQFFAKGNIPGVVGGDTGILKAFSQRNFSPFMQGIGFGGKYLPTEAASQTIGGTYTSGEAGYGLQGGETISGETLKEYNRLSSLGSGASDAELVEMARKNVLSGEAGGGIIADTLGFAKNNPELVLAGGVLLDQLGFFDEGEKDELPQPPGIGTQGSLPVGVAGLVNPVLNPDGTYSFSLRSKGGIMNAKEGKRVKRKLTDEERDYMDDYLLNKMMEDMMNKLRDKQMKEEQFKPKFNMMGKEILEAKDGNIASFKENSPRKDLFLERDGPISDDRGSPDKDTVYAKLADGEFVVNADTVADIGYSMGAKGLDQAKEMGGSFFYGLQDAQKKGILGNMIRGVA